MHAVEKIQKTVKEVKMVEHIEINMQLIRITFTDETSAVAYGNFNTYVLFTGKEVIAELREELINKVLEKCVTTIAEVSRICTLEREENIKLYVGEMPVIGCTLDFSDMDLGQTLKEVTLYCLEQKYESSKKTDWATLKCLDKNRRVGIIRLFAPDQKYSDFSGRYINIGELRKNSYGYNASLISEATGIEFPPNPEIKIARTFIDDIIKEDKELVEFVTKTNLLNRAEDYYFNEEIERGYVIVRMAMAIAIAKEYKNISPVVDTKLLIRAIIAEKAYVLSNNEKTTLSKTVQNIIHVTKHTIGQDKRLINIIDVNPPIEILEKSLLHDIKNSVLTLVRARMKFDTILAKDKIWG